MTALEQQEITVSTTEAHHFAAGPAGPAAAVMSGDGVGDGAADISQPTLGVAENEADPGIPDKEMRHLEGLVDDLLEPGTPSEICFRAWGDAPPVASDLCVPDLVSKLASWLQSPTALGCCNRNGFVAIQDAISLCSELREASGGHLHTVEEAVRTLTEEGPIILSSEGRAVQLRTVCEKINDDLRAEDKSLPPGWRSGWDHILKCFFYFACDVGGVQIGPVHWEKPPCFPENSSPAMVQLAGEELPRQSIQDLSATIEPCRPAQVGTTELSPTPGQNHADEAGIVPKAEGLSLVNVAAAAVDEQEFPNDSEYKLGLRLTCDEDAASLQDASDPLVAKDPWQDAPFRTASSNEAKWPEQVESAIHESGVPNTWWQRKVNTFTSDLYIGGLSLELSTEEFVKELFGTIEVTEIYIPKDYRPGGGPRGYAFVSLADKSKIEDVIRCLHDMQVGPDGKRLTVRHAEGRKGMDGKDSGSKGNRKGTFHGFQGKSKGLKGRDVFFKGKGRSYQGKGFGSESLGCATVDGQNIVGVGGQMSPNAAPYLPCTQELVEPSLVAVCSSNVVLQQSWFQDASGSVMPCSFWVTEDTLSEVPTNLPQEFSLPGVANAAGFPADVPEQAMAEEPEQAVLLSSMEYLSEDCAPTADVSIDVPDGVPTNSAEQTPAEWLAEACGEPEKEPDQAPWMLQDHGLILAALEQWLSTSSGTACFESHGTEQGFLSIQEVIDSCPEVRELSGGRPELVVAAIRFGPQAGLFELSYEGTSMRLRGLLERARLAAEIYLAQDFTRGNLSLLDLLQSDPVASILRIIPEATERLQTLKDALLESSLVAVCGSRAIWQQCFSYEGPDVTMDFYFPPSTGHVIQPASQIGPDNPAAPSCWDRKGWGGKGASQPWWKSEVRKDSAGIPKQRLDRRTFVTKMTLDLLRSREGEEAAKNDRNGWVSINRLFDLNSHFASLMFRNPAVVIKGLAGLQTQLACNAENQTVRLLTPQESICYITEQLLFEKTPDAVLQMHNQRLEMSLDDLLLHPEIKEVLDQSATKSRWRTPKTLLRQALADSENLQLKEDEMLGTWMVEMRPVAEILLGTVEEFLETDAKAVNMLQSEGEVPLSWMASERPIQRTFARIKTNESMEAGIETLRSAVKRSSQYELDTSGMSIRLIAPSRRPRSQNLPEAQRMAHGGPKRHKQSWEVKEKDATQLRKLIAHYFEPFNLQHNRVLMSIIYAQRKQRNQRSYLQCSGLRPSFGLEDLGKLPRIGKLLEQYDEAGSWLLAAALKTDEKLPVRLRQQRDPRAPRGAWATPDPKVELTYIPSFRFVEVVRDCPEVQPLLAPQVNPFLPLQHVSGSAFNVVSFSISSDLSHNQSPKALDVIDEITAGGLDPANLTWESRLPKIKRQVLQYVPDFICVQGVQSIGFAERCSELQPAWFHSDNEPTGNHLVYLYRELSKENYGVTFSPSLKLPGSEVFCFGNAVFWKRSRWQVDQRWAIQRSAICVLLSSKCDCPKVLVCSSKSPAAYVRDWGGDAVPESLLVEPMGTVQDEIMEAASTNNARPVWCGDFGCEPSVLLPSLPRSARAATRAPPKWQSTSMTVLDGESAWTSVSKYTAGLEVDLILHDEQLEVLAGLGGLLQSNSLVDLVKSGYSSDHLLQMAVFKDLPRSNERRSKQSYNKHVEEENLMPTWATNLPSDSRWRVRMGTGSGANGRADVDSTSISAPPGLPSKTLIAFQ